MSSSRRTWSRVAALVGAVALAVLLLELGRPLPSSSATMAVQRGAWELIATPTSGWRALRRGDEPPVVLPARPRRVVSQALVVDELLFGLGAEEQVAALSVFAANRDYSLCAEAAAAFPAVTGGSEQVLAFRPDLVLAARHSSQEMVDQLRSAGVPVVILGDFDALEAMLDNALVVGFCLGRDTSAERLVEEARRRIAAARTRLRAGDPPPLRVVSWESGFVEAKGSVFAAIARELGLVEVAGAAGLDGWPAVGAEQIATWDPDYLFTRAKPGQEEAQRRAILAHPAIAASRLGREPERVIVLPSSLGSTVSHHVAAHVEAIAERLGERR